MSSDGDSSDDGSSFLMEQFRNEAAIWKKKYLALSSSAEGNNNEILALRKQVQSLEQEKQDLIESFEVQFKAVEDELTSQTRIFQEAKRNLLEPGDVDRIRAELVAAMQDDQRNTIKSFQEINSNLQAELEHVNTELQTALNTQPVETDQDTQTDAVRLQLGQLHETLGKAHEEMSRVQVEAEDAVRRHARAARDAEARADEQEKIIAQLQTELETATFERDKLRIQLLHESEQLRKERFGREGQNELMKQMEGTLSSLFEDYQRRQGRHEKEKKAWMEKLAKARGRRRLAVSESTDG
ncbi:Chromosome partition protein Smc [Carpediemonas membranifera]|uniref:Chromosome partition protein Smc n=1 Tax=Carpediemonas membranifera TaxID=201153 RepID=A0A8J6ARR4_9EUKA|nr:Chromosome partition protein Smc [Carpediemonas membranifera]|eukprot:KAG9392641.1 Chromosome partition protein Smc [Carpediemonas membranifera]